MVWGKRVVAWGESLDEWAKMKLVMSAYLEPEKGDGNDDCCSKYWEILTLQGGERCEGQM
jgi:hypothetical protein